ncbi:hypothetical protein LX69_03238 [Breznakibacter xylanolyticus]|uniref:Uncharacterized protein n=1 Tax=Breznakibacter xylanolyticus TaxID=990 RepID=A0A2W7MXM0_9BACT|nr:DUF5606 domain-containing protein [Breznakibacter xylanolyticus]MBN2743815.1 DUF5606 domain-containing protein [Marinilabiliaceae bacterium]PZX10917.1 hypothetical protein LX69_03238 [Breznakibacter xylanolyticus]
MLKEILAISGQGGLFKVISQAKNAIIVESLVDGKRMPAHASSRISALEDISVYTEDGDMKLAVVFKRIADKENNGEAIDAKSSNDQLKAYFEQVLPEYDKERVYVSDIKKIISWYNLLVQKQMLDFSIAEEVEDNTEA